MESVHKTVLLQETIEGLEVTSASVVIDCTFGGGGHSAEICRRSPGIQIIALDQDKTAFEKAKDKFKDLDCDITFVNANFGDLGKVSAENPVSEKLKDGVDAIMFDLGLSSDQLENSGRGFTFLKDEPLLMTMKAYPEESDLTASDIVNAWSETSLADIIYGYGEERYARRIARSIAESRKKAPIATTFELVKIITEAVPGGYKRGRLHPATKTFQAIRMAVNDELGVLEKGLTEGFEMLKNGGRMAVISFHSLEDRIVKRFYKAKEKEGRARLVHKKPILAGAEELKNNPRSRSAKLRILEKIIA